MATQRRMIYAQMAENKSYATMSDKAQKTYVFLIVLADDEGRLKGDTDWLRIKIFPYNPEITRDDMRGYIKEITKAGLITWYKSEDGNYYISHPNWEKYQKLRADRMKESDIPQPNDNQVSTKRVRKLSKDKIKEDKIINSLSYLKKIPEKDLQEFYERFDCSKKAIISKAEDLVLWCDTNGREKKNYKTFLLNALKKDFQERKEPVRKPIVVTPDIVPVPLSPEERKPIPEDIKNSINAIIGNKTIKND